MIIWYLIRIYYFKKCSSPFPRCLNTRYSVCNETLCIKLICSMRIVWYNLFTLNMLHDETNVSHNYVLGQFPKKAAYREKFCWLISCKVLQSIQQKQIADEDSEGSTADSELARAGRQAPPGNGWKREHEFTFLDSDWPSFRNTVHSLCLSLSILSPFSAPQWSSQTNHAKLTSKFSLEAHWISHRTADLCGAGGRSWANEGSAFAGWMSLLF